MGAPNTSERTDIQMVEKAAVGTLPPEVQKQLELRKLSNQIAGKLAEMNWGKSLDWQTRRAVADWGQQFRVDVTTEIDVLGSNIYLNARFYLRKLSEMIAAGLVEYAIADHIEDDDRLKKLGPEGEGEYTRRLRERIMHGVPDAAKSAVVFRVKLRNLTQEITGIKWCGGGTRKNDPVGEAFPIEAAETRAARRAMRLIASHVPINLSAEVQEIEGAAEIVSQRIEQSHEQLAKEIAAQRPPQQLSAPAQDDPYGAPVAAQPVEAPVQDSLL